MKKVIVIVLIVAMFTMFTGIVWAEEGSQEKLLRDYEIRMTEYIEKQKEPLLASGLSVVIPSAGHFYAGDWGRGFNFLLGETAAGVVWLNSLPDTEYNYNTGEYETVDGSGNNPSLLISGATYLGLRIWEVLDANKTAKKYNNNLRRELNIRPQIRVKGATVETGINYSF